MRIIIWKIIKKKWKKKNCKIVLKFSAFQNIWLTNKKLDLLSLASLLGIFQNSDLRVIDSKRNKNKSNSFPRRRKLLLLNRVKVIRKKKIRKKLKDFIAKL